MDKIKEFIRKVSYLALKYSKYVYPAIALVLAAVAVVVSLNLAKKSREKKALEEELLTQTEEIPVVSEDTEVPLEVSSDELLRDFITSYFQALSDGDEEVIISDNDIIEESEVLRLEEQSKYLNYIVNEVYTQEGMDEGTYIAYVYAYVILDEYPDVNMPYYKGFYVKTSDEGKLYIVNSSNITEEENEYISNVSSQDDVIEFNNKVNVEYNEVVSAHPDVLQYMIDLDTTVSTELGEKIAQLNASDTEQEETDTDAEQTEDENIPLENQTQYATATTAVNVRKSDSAGSDRLGEVSQGEKLEVVEVQENGWTKVIYNGSEAFIKSEYLSLIQSADGVPTIGMMTALEAVNVRSEADTNSERLGALVAGDQYEIAAVENGWVTIKFDGILAYVNAEYCDCTIF